MSDAPVRSGFEEEVGRHRAVPRSGGIETDPSPMVQELVARLRFTADHVDFTGRDILDYGCGTGVALEWIRSHRTAGRLTGLDASTGAIAFARSAWPGIQFDVLDIEQVSPGLRSSFDVAICYEVIEHLRNPESAIEHLATRYLRPSGTLVVSTPNRLVFSAGMEPSPINRTHLHEMDLAEFRDVLDRWFEEVAIWGMRFHDPRRQAAFLRSTRESADGYRLFGERWWNPWISRFYRWILRGGLWRSIRGTTFHRWMAGDFAFDDADPSSSIWFIAIAKKPRSRQA